MKKGQVSSFKGKVGKADEKFKGGSNYGYLILPEGIGVFSPELETSVLFDIMPYVVSDLHHPESDKEEGIALVGDLWWRRPFKIHRNIGSEKNSVVCLQSFGKKCPVCEYKAKLLKEGKLDDDSKEALKTSDRVLYCIIPLNGKKDGKPIPKTPHIFDISYAMFGKKLKKEMDDENVSEICMDLTEGASLKVRFDEKSMGGKNSKPFAEAGRIDSKERDNPYKESILEKIPDLDKVLKEYSYKELEAKFFELEGEEADEEERPKAKKANKKVVEEDDDDDEEPAPPTRNKKKATPVVEEDDDDDDDAADDDDAPELTWEDISKMKQVALIELCDDLDVDPDDYDDDIKAFRRAIAIAMDIKVPKTVPAPAPIPEKDKCPVCKGSGKNKKGGACETCAGTGVKQKAKAKKAEEEDDDDDEPAPKKKGKAKPKTEDDECPSGYRFGIDTDRKDECDSCDLWDECMKQKKANKK